MSKQKTLGEFEILILAALIHQGRDAYGVSIRHEIDARAGQTASLGAIYATLHRLEKKGYVTSRMGEATAERGGRAKKHYEITAAGRIRFDHSLRVVQTMTAGIAPWPEASS